MQVELIIDQKPLGLIIGKHPIIPSAIEVKFLCPDSNAGKAGVLPGDIFRTINGSHMFPLPPGSLAGDGSSGRGLCNSTVYHIHHFALLCSCRKTA
jgi:hypothetical protein